MNTLVGVVWLIDAGVTYVCLELMPSGDSPIPAVVICLSRQPALARDLNRLFRHRVPIPEPIEREVTEELVDRAETAAFGREVYEEVLVAWLAWVAMERGDWGGAGGGLANAAANGKPLAALSRPGAAG